MKSVIRSLQDFGEFQKPQHKDYQSAEMLDVKKEGGLWKVGKLTFYFPADFGFCYGVQKAIDLVFETCDRFLSKEPKRRVFLTDQLIHSPYINELLKQKGVHYLKRGADHLLICDDLRREDVVVVAAFGTDFRDIERLRQKGVTVVDTTCGAIIHVWKRVESYARDGFITVMHGKRSHEETRATVSQVLKHGGGYLIIENVEEASELAEVILGKNQVRDFVDKYPGCAPSADYLFDPEQCRLGMANQTTMLKEESLEIQRILCRAFTDRFGRQAAGKRFRNFQTICAATQDRQRSLLRLLELPLDLMLVVGGFNSSNTAHLAEMASSKKGLPVYPIESASDLLPDGSIRYRDPLSGQVKQKKAWMPAGLRHIGLASGASTPDRMLAEVVKRVAERRG